MTKQPFNRRLNHSISRAAIALLLCVQWSVSLASTEANGDMELGGNPLEDAHFEGNLEDTPFEENKVVVEELRQAIKKFAQQHYAASFPRALIKVEINGRLNGLRNRECGEIIELHAPRHLNRSGNILINVSCSFPQKWKAFVPAAVDVSQEVIVAVGPIARDMPINASNTKTKRINLDSFRDQYITDLKQAQGMVARRTFRDGQIIRTDQITRPVLVKRGDKVLILADAGQTQVKMFGTALSAGRQGEQIKVRNSSSSRVIFGQITQSGQVRVNL